VGTRPAMGVLLIKSCVAMAESPLSIAERKTDLDREKCKPRQKKNL
jgi:hypothetical protein